MAESLLVELLTEELPPKSLKRLSEAFGQSLFELLRGLRFLESATSQIQLYATPRRLAVRITSVRDKQIDLVGERKGPSVSAGLDASGQPTSALLGFAKSCGVEVGKLERVKGDKGEQFAYRFKQKGEPLKSHLAGVVEATLKKLPIAKLMRWGDGEAQFVRPVHGLVMLHGSRVVLGTVLGLKSGNKTLGHRFLSKRPIAITRADKYADILRKTGKVLASFEERRKVVEKQLRTASKGMKAHVFLPQSWDVTDSTSKEDEEFSQRIFVAQTILGANEELLDEVTALVEWPAVYAGEFEREFLEVPTQCIGLTMQKNQKYFALMSEKAELLPKYLLVSNLETGKPDNIINGNARVLRARLADAKFFYEQDRKTKLADRVPRLADVVYHNKLGSQLERVQRIQKLAIAIAGKLKTDTQVVERAAYLCKADLLTEMVGEFPELQGVMGYYYALHDEEPLDVSKAITRHYLPRFAGDGLPTLPADICLALADKLDTLAGIYGIGLVPTGEKDPHGLRRAALGVARILVEKSLPLDVLELLARAAGNYPNGVLSDAVTQDLHGFILERLRPYLREQDFAPDEIEAVLVLNPTRLDQVVPRLAALRKFRAAPEGQALAAANKRIRNILRQAGGAPAAEVNEALLKDEAEKKLARAVQALHGEVTPLFRAGDYAGALKRLASLRPEVDEFFDKVMVMADDAAVRNNRLALLNNLGNLFLQVADISRLQG